VIEPCFSHQRVENCHSLISLFCIATVKRQNRSTLRYGPVTDYVLPPVCVDSVRWHSTVRSLRLRCCRYRYWGADTLQRTAQALQRSVCVVLRWHCATTVHAVRHYAICAADDTTLHVWHEETTIDAIFFMEHQSLWQLSTQHSRFQLQPVLPLSPESLRVFRV